MGLDMYLSARKYISKYRDEDKPINDTIMNAFGTDGDIPGHVSQIKLEVMYWRKANAIHAWFVRNVQNGVDDCGEYPVSHEMLTKLQSDIAAVINRPILANRLLPPQSGFFFGSTDIDEGYWDDLKQTHAELDKIIATYGNPNNDLYGWELTYQSSW